MVLVTIFHQPSLITKRTSMRFLHTILLVVFLIFSHAMPAMGEEPHSYLCIPDAATGFRLNESGKWIETNFDIEETKYLLSKKKGIWLWDNFENPSYTTSSRCHSVKVSGFIMCDSLFTLIRFSRETLRFMKIYYSYDYLHQDTDPNTPYIMIGTCSPL